MRREKLYLTDIVEAADAAASFLGGVGNEEFLSSDLVRSAVLQKLMIIGEAAARLPQPFRESHAEIAWVDIISFRNVAAHAYFALRWQTVWTIVTQEVPKLRAQVAGILTSEFPD